MDAETQTKIEKTFKALEKEFLASLKDFEKRLNTVTRSSGREKTVILLLVLTQFVSWTLIGYGSYLIFH